LRNDIVFASILFTEIFDKAFEVWLLQLHEPKYFMNKRRWLWEQNNDFKRGMLLHTVDQWE